MHEEETLSTAWTVIGFLCLAGVLIWASTEDFNDQVIAIEKYCDRVSQGLHPDYKSLARTECQWTLEARENPGIHLVIVFVLSLLETWCVPVAEELYKRIETGENSQLKKESKSTLKRLRGWNDDTSSVEKAYPRSDQR